MRGKSHRRLHVYMRMISKDTDYKSGITSNAKRICFDDGSFHAFKFVQFCFTFKKSDPKRVNMTRWKKIPRFVKLHEPTRLKHLCPFFREYGFFGEITFEMRVYDTF